MLELNVFGTVRLVQTVVSRCKVWVRNLTDFLPFQKSKESILAECTLGGAELVSTLRGGSPRKILSFEPASLSLPSELYYKPQLSQVVHDATGRKYFINFLRWPTILYLLRFPL